eukprot:3692059-Ditylum_brightwellii.AAC.1
MDTQKGTKWLTQQQPSSSTRKLTSISGAEKPTKKKTKMFTVIIGQCTDLMISKLESDPSWTNINDESNVVELLTTIKGIAYKYESQSFV